MSDSIIYGRNSVMEALKAGRDLEKIYILKDASSGSVPAIRRMAKAQRIPVQETDRT